MTECFDDRHEQSVVSVPNALYSSSGCLGSSVVGPRHVQNMFSTFLVHVHGMYTVCTRYNVIGLNV